MAKKKKPSKKNAADVVVNSTDSVVFFEVLGSFGRILMPSGLTVDLSQGVPKNALELYKSGFRYLGLKKGAEVLFMEEPVATLEKLIAQAARPEDVVVLKKALKK